MSFTFTATLSKSSQIKFSQNSRIFTEKSDNVICGESSRRDPGAFFTFSAVRGRHTVTCWPLEQNERITDAGMGQELLQV